MINVAFIILGLIFLIKGADFLIDGASSVARKFKISEFVIGLTVIAVGTSLPELIVSIQSILKGSHNLLIGNVVGSCIYNLLLILGIISIIKPIQIKRESNIILMLFSILAVGMFGNMYGMITKIEGILLILIFIIFLLSSFSDKKEERKETQESLVKSLIFLVIGVILLKYGGDFVVESSTILAKNLGISEKIIGVTIIAMGTSLPELVTSIMAIKKNNIEIAVGNIIGSNIFNLLLVLGTTSLIKPITFPGEYNFDLIFLLIITLMIIITCLKNKNEEIKRKEGIILVTFFILYNIQLFTK